MAQRVCTLTAKSSRLSLIPGTCKVEGDTCFLQVVLWLPYEGCGKHMPTQNGQTDRQTWETTNQSTWSPPLTEQEPIQNTLINVEKTPDRIYIFHDKNSQAMGTSSAWGSLDVRNTELTLNSWWRADSFPARTGEGHLLLLISFATVMEGLARAIRRKLKAVWPGNEELRLFLYADNVIS